MWTKTESQTDIFQLLYMPLDVTFRVSNNAPGMITDTHDNNIICAQKLNHNRTFFKWRWVVLSIHFNLPNRLWGLLLPQRNKIVHIFVIGWFLHKLRFCHTEDPLTFGVWKDHTTCFVLVFWPPVRKVKQYPLLCSYEIRTQHNITPC